MSTSAAFRLASLASKAASIVGRFVRTTFEGPGRKYRPEEHYMRGPGPKWREKHFTTRGA